MRLILLAAASVLLAGATASALAADEDHPILPGYWESTSKVSFPLPSTKTERKCVSGEQINAYLTGPANPHYVCHYDKTHIADGQAVMEGECIDSGVRAKVKIKGTYTAESFQLTSHLQAVIGGLGIPIEASIDAHRLSGECPAGMKVDTPEKKKEAAE